VFTLVFVVAARLRVIGVAEVLIAPRGELSPGALIQKARKKRLFLKSWRPFLKQLNVLWHASNELEAAQIRAVCPWARVEVNQDQCDLPMDPIPAARPGSGPARLVFISRICAKKNLRMVLQALSDTARPVDLDIFGTLEDLEYWSRCQRLITRLPATARGRLPR